MKFEPDLLSSSHPLLSTGSASGSPSPTGDRPNAHFKLSNYRWASLLPFKRQRSKAWLVLVAALLAGFAFSLLFSGEARIGVRQVGGWRWRSRPKSSEGLVKPGGRRGVNESYLDNLLPTINYVTSFHIAGLNNEIITQFNLLHVTYLSRNNPASPHPWTPIIPPFLPHFDHIGKKGEANAAPVLRFSQVFDIDRLAESIGFGILEWADLKSGDPRFGIAMGGRIEDEWKTEDERAEERKAIAAGEIVVGTMGEGLREPEMMGCWSAWMSMWEGGRTIYPSLSEYYGFETSLTPLPRSLFAATPRHSPAHLSAPSLANFITPPENRIRTDFLHLKEEAERDIQAWRKGMTRDDVFDKNWVEPSAKPGEVTCFDALYYVSDKGEEVREVYRAKPPLPRDAGPWWSVGQYAYWNPELRAIGVNTLRQVLGMREGKAIPNVFTMHIRRTDFLPSCPVDAQPCLAVSHFANHLNYLRDLYVTNGERGAKDWPVVVTTDESDEEYLAEIASQGWFVVDHDALQTKKRHGIWYPSMIDNVVLSLGRGFVGTERSTMSILAGRRVEDWNGGFTTIVEKTETRRPFDPKNPDP